MAPSAAMVAWALSFAAQASGLAPPPASWHTEITIGGILPGFNGMTDPWSGHVYLPADWNPDDPIAKCSLAHEMTHVLQVVHQIHFRRPQDAEPPAYAVTIRCFESINRPDLAAWVREGQSRMIAGGLRAQGF